MQIQQKFTYNMEVSRQELRLIGLALAGRLKDNSTDAKAAAELNKKLLELQAHELTEELSRIDGVLRVINPDGD